MVDNLHKAITFLFLQKKRKLCQAVSKVLSGVTELLGTFVQELAEAGESSGPSVRRSNRRTRTEIQQVDLSEDDSEEDNDYIAEDDSEEDSDCIEEDDEEGGWSSDDYNQDTDPEELVKESIQERRTREKAAKPMSGQHNKDANSSRANEQQAVNSPHREGGLPTWDDDDNDFIPPSKHIRDLQSGAKQAGKAPAAACSSRWQ